MAKKDDYVLLPNESIIMTEGGIYYGGDKANSSHELILTNFNLVLVSKGSFGKTKNVRTFPIQHIKATNNRAQVILSETKSGSPQIEIYFVNGVEMFGFDDKNEAITWINKINFLVTGEETVMDVPTKKVIPGTEMIADALAGTVDVFKNAFGIKSKKPSDEADRRVAGKCCYCGAAISGIKGQVVRCSYCDGDQQL